MPDQKPAQIVAFTPSPSAADRATGTRERDPRRFPFGLLLAETGLAQGVMGFHWFSDEAEALNYLVEAAWEEHSEAGYVDEVQAMYQEAIARERRLDEDWLCKLSGRQDDLHVIWFGSFEQLRSGTDTFEAGVVEQFREFHPNPGTEPEAIQTFIDFLHDYCRFDRIGNRSSASNANATTTRKDNIVQPSRFRRGTQSLESLLQSEGYPARPNERLLLDAGNPRAGKPEPVPGLPTGLMERIRKQFRLDWKGIHGAPHWARVMHHGMWLARRTGADAQVVRLFAVLHDSQRRDEGRDPGHGQRAAEFVRVLHQERIIQLDGKRLEWLIQACTGHSDGLLHAPLSVQVCWDADRLDLGRVGIRPNPDYLCTDVARDPFLIDLAWNWSQSPATK